MNKEGAYPWIGAVIGGITGILLSIIIPSSDFYIRLNSILFGTIIGCFYGSIYNWITEEKRTKITAIIIAGIVGSLFGLHPVSLCIFGFAGAYAVVTFIVLPSDKELTHRLITYLLSCAILGAILGLFSVFYPPFDILTGKTIDAPPDPVVGAIAYAILGLIPLFNIGMGLVCGISTGQGIAKSIVFAHPLFVIPLFAFIGYVIGKPIMEIAEKRLEEKKKLEVYKTKIERWKKEGYDVSELEEMLK